MEREEEIELEIRLVRDMNNSGNSEVRPSAEVENFPNGIFAAEIFLGHSVADHDGIRVGKGLSGISLKERKRKYFKEGGVDHQKIHFCIGFLFVADNHVVGTPPGDGGDLRELVLEGGPEREGEPGMDRNGVAQVIFHDYPVDVFGIIVKPVIGELVPDPKED